MVAVSVGHPGWAHTFSAIRVSAPHEPLSYPQIVLAFFAAVLPIVGSLYAAFSYLIEKAAVDHEWRVRRRLIPLREERFHRLLPAEKARAAQMGVEFDMDVFMHKLDEMDRVLYAANGVRFPASLRVQSLNASMTRNRLSVVETRRQWVLLLSSACGLILLAMDANTP